MFDYVGADMTYEVCARPGDPSSPRVSGAVVKEFMSGVVDRVCLRKFLHQMLSVGFTWSEAEKVLGDSQYPGSSQYREDQKSFRSDVRDWYRAQFYAQVKKINGKRFLMVPVEHPRRESILTEYGLHPCVGLVPFGAESAEVPSGPAKRGKSMGSEKKTSSSKVDDERLAVVLVELARQEEERQVFLRLADQVKYLLYVQGDPELSELDAVVGYSMKKLKGLIDQLLEWGFIEMKDGLLVLTDSGRKMQDRVRKYGSVDFLRVLRNKG